MLMSLEQDLLDLIGIELITQLISIFNYFDEKQATEATLSPCDPFQIIAPLVCLPCCGT